MEPAREATHIDNRYRIGHMSITMIPAPGQILDAESAFDSSGGGWLAGLFIYRKSGHSLLEYRRAQRSGKANSGGHTRDIRQKVTRRVSSW